MWECGQFQWQKPLKRGKSLDGECLHWKKQPIRRTTSKFSLSLCIYLWDGWGRREEVCAVDVRRGFGVLGEDARRLLRHLRQSAGGGGGEVGPLQGGAGTLPGAPPPLSLWRLCHHRKLLRCPRQRPLDSRPSSTRQQIGLYAQENPWHLLWPPGSYLSPSIHHLLSISIAFSLLFLCTSESIIVLLSFRLPFF